MSSAARQQWRRESWRDYLGVWLFVFRVLGTHFESVAVRFGKAAGAEHLGEQRLGRFGQGAFLNRPDRRLDVVLDALQFDAIVFNDSIRGTRVPVAWLPHAAGVNHERLTDFQDIGMVSMADANHVRF